MKSVELFESIDKRCCCQSVEKLMGRPAPTATDPPDEAAQAGCRVELSPAEVPRLSRRTESSE